MDASIENKLLQEQLLQEAFLDSVKAYAQEKYNKIVSTISDWKDAAAIIGNVISNPTVLQRFSDDVWYNFKRDTLKRLIALLNKLGLSNLVASINGVVTKITSLTGWQKFLAATGIGAIAEYVVDKMAGLAPDAIKNFIASYLSENGLKTIISKLTDFKSYLGWLQPIIKGVDMLYQVMKSSIAKFGTGIFTNKMDLVKKENKEMDLKEYIKQLVQQELDEMSVSGDAGSYLTPNAFSPKGQKTNAATAQAMRSGWTKASGMPKKSKVLDYKELWKGKKSAMNENTDFKVGDKVEYENQEWEIISFLANGTVRLKNLKGLPSVNVIPGSIKKISESNYDKASQKGQASGYTASSGYTAGGIKGDDYYKKESMNKTLLNIIDQELLNEVTYGKFKKDVKHRTKSEQLHKAIREVKRKLQEIDRIVEYTSRMKQELSEDGGINYWKATQKNVATISEMVNQLNNKIKNLNQ
jgi:hypothetical protein